MEFTLTEGPGLVEAHPGDEWEEAKVKLFTLKQKWEALLLEAEQRSALCPAMIERAPLCDTNLEQIWSGFIHMHFYSAWCIPMIKEIRLH